MFLVPTATESTDDKPKYRVFISYSNKDVDLALEMMNALGRAGLTALLSESDTSVAPFWNLETLRVLRSAECLLVIDVPDSAKKAQALVELGPAWAQKRSQLPHVVSSNPVAIPEILQGTRPRAIDTKPLRGNLAKELAQRLNAYAANQPVDLLSVAELNAIAAEFAIVFRNEANDAVWANQPFGHVRQMLADKCEEAGSRWCEAIRAKPEFLHCIWAAPFILTE
jgi:hypothetical protein